MKTIFYDGENKILGRLASHIAQNLIAGNKVITKNVAKIIITGDLKRLREKYLMLLNVGTERKGPFFKRSEIGYFKKAVEGMLPMKKGPGKGYTQNLYLFEYELPENHPVVKFTEIKTQISLNKKTTISKVTTAIRGKQNKNEE